MTNKNNLPPIKLGSPGEEISKKDLHAVSQRFKNLHQLRKQRIQEFLQPRQRFFLDLLPLILHQNHPLLPGFITSDTLAGIPDYSPNRNTINCARQFSKSFKYKRRILKSYPIQGLFLMGSVSSIAFSKTSDMDIWLCHESELPPESLDLLKKKTEKIEQWAETLGLEAHFFLIDSVLFKTGQCTPISSESSGETQHYLLLEEFYRTSIYIAGKIPAWWLVPPHEENNYSTYVRHLQQKRFISSHDIIDFGDLQSIPATEFISATLWHLYKSINSPHKSLLKLLLMESYASEFPNPQWLCLNLKQAIFQGQLNLDELDPYLLIYRKVEQYLQHAQDPQRLDLARQSFYLKIMGDTRSPLNEQRQQLRTEFLHEVAISSRWPAETLSQLSKRTTWNIIKAIQEHNTIIRQLTQCYRMTIGFAGKYVHKGYRNNKDLQLIGRKLFSFLEKKPGKIEIITTRSAVQSKEEHLSLQEIPLASGGLGWRLCLESLQDEQNENPQVIKKSRHLFDVLAWLVINRLYHNKLKLHIESSSLRFSESELHLLLARLNQFLSDKHDTPEASLEIYRHANKLLAAIIFINTGFPLPEYRRDGMLTISDRSDVLSYGKDRQIFVYTIDEIALSSWGEITTCHHEGIDGLFNALTSIINNHKGPIAISDLSVFCNTPLRAKSITLRINELFTSLVKWLIHTNNTANRLLLPGGPFYYVFQKKNGILRYWQLENEAAIYDELAKPQINFSAVHFDPGVLSNTPVPFLYQQNKANHLQLFFQIQNTKTDLYIIDEKGALFTRQHKKMSTNQLLVSYSVFFEALLNRGLLDYALTIEYHEIQVNSAGFLSCVSIETGSIIPWHNLNLRITGAEEGSSAIAYNLYCNEQEFSSINYGDQVFEAAAEHILKVRQDHEFYPIYITDIDVPASVLGVHSANEIQSIHLLQYKQKIETRLNHSINLCLNP